MNKNHLVTVRRSLRLKGRERRICPQNSVWVRNKTGKKNLLTVSTRTVTKLCRCIPKHFTRDILFQNKKIHLMNRASIITQYGFNDRTSISSTKCRDRSKRFVPHYSQQKTRNSRHFYTETYTPCLQTLFSES